jgi:TolC family type I secretion outer membrane protein
MRKFVAPLFPGTIAALLLALSPPGRVAAQPLSLADCTRMALSQNVSVAQSRQFLESANADVLSARSAFLPSVSSGGSWTKPEEVIEVFQGGQLRFFDEPWSARVDGSLLLFDGLGNLSTYRQATNARSSAREEFLDSRQEVVYQTEIRFFEVRKQEALLEVQRQAVNQSGEQLKKTRAMKDLGAATQADVYKAEVDHSNNRLTELRTERDLNVAKASLAEYVGLDPRQDLDLAEEDLEIPDDFDLAGASERALEVNPRLRAADLELQARESGVSAAKSDRYPSLNLFANADYFNFELQDFDDEHIEWRYGISMSFTIFDGFRTKANIRRAQAQELLSRRSREVAERQVLLDVRESFLDLEIARQSIAVAEEAVRSSEEDLRLAQERYKIGEGTILDVIDAQVNLIRSKTDLVNATYDRRLAVSALRNAIGDIPVPEPAE